MPELQLNAPSDVTEASSPASGDAANEASKTVNAKRAWTEEEDEKLLEAVTKYGPQRWSLISTHLVGRVGKQCRERWFNHLCPEVSKGEWTAEEDEAIALGVRELGTKWSEIVKRLPGRTDNAIKNRYNSNKRRELRAERREEEEKNAPDKQATPQPKAGGGGGGGGGGNGGGKPKGGGERKAGGGSKPKSGKARPRAEDLAEGDEDGPLQQLKRQRVIELATKLAKEVQSGDEARRDALMQQLMDETVGYTLPRARECADCGASNSAACRCRLVLGSRAPADDDALGLLSSPHGDEGGLIGGPGLDPSLDLEMSIETLFSDSGLSDSGDDYSPSGAGSADGDGSSPAVWGPKSPSRSGGPAQPAGEASADEGSGAAERRSGEAPGSDGAERLDGFWRAAASGLRLDLRLAEGGESAEMEVELTGEVRLTAEGAVPITPMIDEAAAKTVALPKLGAEPLLSRAGRDEVCEESDWLTLYKPEVRPDSPVDALPADQQHVLLPLLTPSNSKLCAALVDAFLPLNGSVPIVCS